MNMETNAAETLLDELRVATQVGEDDAVYRELGWALVAEGQLLLDETSSKEDVELFFEVYGYPRGEAPRSWVCRILAGLEGRLDEGDASGVRERSVERAVRKLAGSAG